MAENIPVIADHAARGGAVTVPGVDCGSRCADFWVEEHRPIPNQPSSTQLHRELRSLRIRARVLPALRVAGTIGLAVGTFDVGWKIGTGIRTKLLKLEVPEHTPWNPSWQQQLTFRTQGSGLGASGLNFPYDGWLWEWSSNGAYWGNYWVTPVENGTAEACPASSNPAGIPSGFTEFIGTPHPNCNSYWNGGGNGGVAHIAATPEDALDPAGPVEDYTTQPYQLETCGACWADAPGTRTQLEDRIQAGFDTGLAPRAEAFYAEQLDPRNHDKATDEDEVCQPSGGASGEDPGLGRGAGNTGEEFRRRYEQVPNDVYPTAGYPATDAPGDGRAYLRWGETSPNVDNSHIEWRGWGYRKIKAKHGWGAADREATRVALLSPNPIPSPTVPGRYEYHGSEYQGAGNAVCIRVVVVDYEKTTDEELRPGYEDLPSAGIITSFGARIG